MRLEEMIILAGLLFAALWYGSEATKPEPVGEWCSTEDVLANRYDCGSDDGLRGGNND